MFLIIIIMIIIIHACVHFAFGFRKVGCPINEIEVGASDRSQKKLCGKGTAADSSIYPSLCMCLAWTMYMYMFFACGSVISYGTSLLLCACPSVGLLTISRAITPAHTLQTWPVGPIAALYSSNYSILQ